MHHLVTRLGGLLELNESFIECLLYFPSERHPTCRLEGACPLLGKCLEHWMNLHWFERTIDLVQSCQLLSCGVDTGSPEGPVLRLS